LENCLVKWICQRFGYVYNKFVNKSSEIVLNVDGTRTERKVRLSNIDVHETLSENVNNNNSDNQLKSIKIENNVNSSNSKQI
jgi:hypothetical protein